MRKEGWAWERGGFGRLAAGTIEGGDAGMVRENGKRLQDSRIQ